MITDVLCNRFASLFYLPSISIPIGFNKDGYPIGIQIIGKQSEDLKVLAFAKKYASKPPLPAQMIKRSVNALTYQADQAIMHMDYDQFLLAREFHKK